MFKLKVPMYEDPYERFFAGRGELTIEDSRTGSSCNAGYLWHVMQLPEHFFPLETRGRRYSRSMLIGEAAINVVAVLDHIPRQSRSEFLCTCGLSDDDCPTDGDEER